VRPTRALLGVDDKTGLVEFARGLAANGVELVATGGTQAALERAGIGVTPVARLTGMPEMLDGRVKTLHPAIHAGILARRDQPAHRRALADHGFEEIDMVVVNLYPFERAARAGAGLDQVVDQIDIGGPTLLRAAAKNWRSVAAVSSPDQYQEVLLELNAGELSEQLLSRLAVLVFRLTSGYDAFIADHLEQAAEIAPGARIPDRISIAGPLLRPLRYGENPHQEGAIYSTSATPEGLAGARQLQGPALSYTNWLDADSAWRIVQTLPRPGAVVVTHTNPCGAAGAPTAAEAFSLAYACDSRSAYGGVVALNQPVDGAAAELLARHFLELVIAPLVTDEAVQRLAGRDRLRLLAVSSQLSRPGLEVRSIDGGVLVQTPDLGDPQERFEVVSRRAPTAAEWQQLRLAWTLVRGVKSNAIVLCRDSMAVGIGAGQMSRVEAIELAISRAGERAAGSCLASDAFFPMADNLEVAAASGIAAAIHPGGSKRDREVIEIADRNGMALVATGVRHFRH
jgi:phosphoribosylaminoimidazolecarboxamide formyltransferase/IMP cyclohydrolase